MTIKININEAQRVEYAQTLSREQRHQARKRMAYQLAELLERDPRENLYWNESQTDLIDLVHEVFVSEPMADRHGNVYTFKELARRACAVLHVTEPRNLYSVIHNARRRKHDRQIAIFNRYCWMMYLKGISNPLNGMIKKV